MAGTLGRGVSKRGRRQKPAPNALYMKLSEKIRSVERMEKISKKRLISSVSVLERDLSEGIRLLELVKLEMSLSGDRNSDLYRAIMRFLEATKDEEI